MAASDDVWGMVVARVGVDAPGALVVLSGVARAPHRLIRGDAALLAALHARWRGFLGTPSWVPACLAAVPPAAAAMALRVAPQRAMAPRRLIQGHGPVRPPPQAAAAAPPQAAVLLDPAAAPEDAAIIWRLCVLRFAPWCTLCHGHCGRQAAPLFALDGAAVRVCGGCLPDAFVSHTALYHEYGVWVGEVLPDSMQQPPPPPAAAAAAAGGASGGAAAGGAEPPKRTLLDELVATTYYAIDRSVPRQRARMSRAACDLRDAGAKEPAVFFWRAHLGRTLRLDKALRGRAAAAAARDRLSSIMRRWALQRLMRRGARALRLARLGRREARLGLYPARDPPGVPPRPQLTLRQLHTVQCGAAPPPSSPPPDAAASGGARVAFVDLCDLSDE